MKGERFPVQVSYFGTASYAELAPMLDELQSRFGSVNTTVHTPDPQPPARGGPFTISLALTFDLYALGGILLAGAAIYAGGFLAELGKQDAKAFRQRLLQIPALSLGRKKIHSSFPLSIMVGTVQFYIESPITEEELALALRMAAELVAAMPDERVNNAEGISGWPIGWDSSSQSWRDALNP